MSTPAELPSIAKQRVTATSVVGVQPDVGTFVPGMGALEYGGHHHHGMLGFHPDATEPLSADFLSKDLKRSDEHVAATLEGAAWSALLSDDERAKLVHSIVGPQCIIEVCGGEGGHTFVEAIVAAFGGKQAGGAKTFVGPEGYMAWQRAWKAAMPDLKCSVGMLCHSDPKTASFCAVPWARGGCFSGQELFGVQSTGAPLHITGMTLVELRGAMVIKMKVFVEMSYNAAKASVEHAAAVSATAAAAASSAAAAKHHTK